MAALAAVTARHAAQPGHQLLSRAMHASGCSCLPLADILCLTAPASAPPPRSGDKTEAIERKLELLEREEEMIKEEEAVRRQCWDLCAGCGCFLEGVASPMGMASRRGRTRHMPARCTRSCGEPPW